MGFLSGLKKITINPIKAIVKDVYTGTGKILVSTGNATKKVIGTTWNATEEVAETIGGEGAVLAGAGFLVAGPIGAASGLAAGTFFKQQKEQRSETLEQQRSLAGLGLSGQEIGFLQATTPGISFPVVGDAISPLIDIIGGEPVYTGTQLSDYFTPVAPQTVQRIGSSTNGGFNINLLLIGIVAVGGFLIFRGKK
ncbi:MAG: hypothetical protein COC02_05075 [Rhodospirillaceae bacterium]|jgi:phage-related tail protein|nr:MAG: hypothetical protein COC02_05035 [Rhodospirillaceae bacterium]PCH82819.1 MAG: hypothetical protein COC02_05075 [Rhodospirillaceae bacterium]